MIIEIPTNCPVCDSELELVNEQLFCRNLACSAKTLKNLLHYTKTVKIMGLGEKTLEKLDISTISELYSLTENFLTEKLGNKIGTKIFAEIEKSKSITFDKFLAGLGIPLVGKTASEKLAKVTSSLEDITIENCKKAGLGPKVTENLLNWIEMEGQYISLPITFQESEPVESGIAVCISGKVPGYTKAELTEILLDYNVQVKDNVTKDIDYLITNEIGTTKVKKAEQYNINIISFDKFMEIINE